MLGQPPSTATRRLVIIGLLVLLLLDFMFVNGQSNNFEPYQLNGGLVAAVAGRDYCVTASDTRLMDGGYEIYTRNHLRSRLWMATNDDNHKGVLCSADGSLEIPKADESTKTISKSVSPPVWIASAGCSADCEALKRIIRSDVRANKYWNSSPLQVTQVANLLSQVLYRRRTFPYYSFCVVSGLSDEGTGHVYQYDAIGSYEQVAVATSGTGRELLQPILDRMFGSFPAAIQQQNDGSEQEEEESVREVAAQDASSANIKAVARSPVTKTQVDCTANEAVEILIRSYRSVAEREISVGDKVVLCVTQRCKNDTTTVKALSAPLKKH